MQPLVKKNACVAVLLRDWGGNALLGWTRLIPHVSPTADEARAILWAVQLAKELNLQSIFVENDSKTCIDALTSSSTTF
jgi:ribonuclease HI